MGETIVIPLRKLILPRRKSCKFSYKKLEESMLAEDQRVPICVMKTRKGYKVIDGLLRCLVALKHPVTFPNLLGVICSRS